MKRQDLSKHHEQAITELKSEIAKIEAQLVETNMKRELAQEKNVRKSKMMRKDIARLKTIIRIKELAASVEKAVNA